ncbi:acyl-CoA N-acyltransferase [Alternaria rosae]|uniref:acyl-CoA N-acyltransferase n=1 Tax=Alternaria rosae TaxID=1187941 RepID=UPI001E8EEE23|nr:acyl-CoA N-acyltransferase [Alternaria rosae]KAH6867130.1 acyl-CoA N-acyltransferase [Alternaria rosae]
MQTVQTLLRQDVGLSAYEAPERPCPVSFHWVPSALDLRPGELDACLGLVHATSGHDYAASAMGWNPRRKRDEMLDADMMYLLLRPAPAVQSCHDAILGFTSFMFTHDDPPHQDRPVLYIYEIHLDERLRGQGLGPRLIQFVENVARACHIRKTMLTVFTANTRAKGMYHSLGYIRDECSPDDRTTRNKVIPAEYVIMSKSID